MYKSLWDRIWPKPEDVYEWKYLLQAVPYPKHYDISWPDKIFSSWPGLSFDKAPGDESPMTTNRSNVFDFGIQDAVVFNNQPDVGEVCILTYIP